MKRICCCFALALGLPLGALSAQEAPVPAPGTRVRVTTPDGRVVVGSLESIDSATILVRRNDSTTVAFSREPATGLDVSAGPGMCSAGRRGGCVFLGFFGGAALGALAGSVSVHSAKSSGNCGEGLCGLVYLVTVPAGAVVGAVVGAIVGGEHWKNADLPARLSVTPDGSGRFAVGLSLQF
jgi:hypothetical protein